MTTSVPMTPDDREAAHVALMRAYIKRLEEDRRARESDQTDAAVEREGPAVPGRRPPGRERVE